MNHTTEIFIVKCLLLETLVQQMQCKFYNKAKMLLKEIIIQFESENK